MDGELLSLEHLSALARAVPEDDERAQITAFLKVRPAAKFGKRRVVLHAGGCPVCKLLPKAQLNPLQGAPHSAMPSIHIHDGHR